MLTTTSVRLAAVLALALATLPAAVHAQRSDYDRVVIGGRVMDPESGLDAVRNIGIRNGRIAIITNAAIGGKDTVRANGLVVAPGFIDLHDHWQDDAGYRFAAMDGVTTALELEGGAWPVAQWYEERAGKALVNYGATVSHGGLREEVIPPGTDFSAAKTTQDSLVVRAAAAYKTATADQVARMRQLLERGLSEGGLGLGMGLAYTPGVARDEAMRLIATAKEQGVTTFVHIRHAGLQVNGGSLDAAQEMIADAAATGASIHIVHVTSTGLRSTPTTLEMLRGARARGIDITTEMYPYEAASTDLRAAIFDPGFQERLGIDYKDIMWVRTGERLTAESFAKYRREGGPIVIFLIPDEAIKSALADSSVMIASDGVEIRNNTGHPRGAGTFARVLGKYAREEKAMPLMDALRRMTLLPARRLEAVAPSMARKGRLKVGADADITVFDPATVIDRATYTQPEQPSAGIPHVLVNGVPVVRDGKVVEGVSPGRGVTREGPRPRTTSGM